MKPVLGQRGGQEGRGGGDPEEPADRIYVATEMPSCRHEFKHVENPPPEGQSLQVACRGVVGPKDRAVVSRGGRKDSRIRKLGRMSRRIAKAAEAETEGTLLGRIYGIWKWLRSWGDAGKPAGQDQGARKGARNLCSRQEHGKEPGSAMVVAMAHGRHLG